MGTNCAPLLANLFLYCYKAEFIQNILKGEKKLGSTNTYSATALTKEEILQNHKSVISSFGIDISKQNQDS